jgi:oxygen-independent coproporphyrinogen-3 oxidase
MQALKTQLKDEIDNYVIKHNKKIETVFIGGGTPSTIKAEEYKEVFELINPHLEKNAEITSEANPNSASRSWQEQMFKHGVKRISFGVQSFNKEKLKFLGRNHSVENATEAIKNASQIGFNSINCDIIYGVEGDSYQSIKKDFDMAFSLPITHISAYSLTIEEGTKFFSSPKVKIDDEDLSYEIFEYINKNNFIQYEISNFAKNENYKSKHNYGYWEHKEYLGIGCGAVGFYKNNRRYTNKDLDAYIKNPMDIEFESLSDDDIKTEKILLGFRCDNGVDIHLFTKEELGKIDTLIENDSLFINKRRVYNKNFLLADELALYILE